VLVLAVLVVAAGVMLELVVGSPPTGPRSALVTVADWGRSLVTGGEIPSWRADSPDRDERLRHLAITGQRLPRAMAAVLIGATLGAAGALLQDGLRNPLASPDLLGVSAGAALVTACAGILHLDVGPLGVTLMATLVGLGVLLVAAGRSSATTVLFGMACTAMLNGMITALVALGAPQDVGLFFQYLMGSLAGRTWQDVALLVPGALLGIPATLLLAGRLDVLRLGDETAGSLGVRADRTRLAVMVLGCVMVSSTVAVAGPIGFVALLAPHVVRMSTGQTRAMLVLPLAAAVGAVMLLGADATGRSLAHPREIAVGIWCAVLGGPALLLILRRRGAR
jgi:iron complex transport system permease protein